MTELGTTRDPRGKSSTATSTALSLGIPGTILIMAFPEMEPETVLGISGAFTVLMGYIGSAMRDSQFLDPEAHKGSFKGFIITLCAKFLG